jgi:hypothetical protein
MQRFESTAILGVCGERLPSSLTEEQVVARAKDEGCMVIEHRSTGWVIGKRAERPETVLAAIEKSKGKQIGSALLFLTSVKRGPKKKPTNNGKRPQSKKIQRNSSSVSPRGGMCRSLFQKPNPQKPLPRKQDALAHLRKPLTKHRPSSPTGFNVVSTFSSDSDLSDLSSDEDDGDRGLKRPSPTPEDENRLDHQRIRQHVESEDSSSEEDNTESESPVDDRLRHLTAQLHEAQQIISSQNKQLEAVQNVFPMNCVQLDQLQETGYTKCSAKLEADVCSQIVRDSESKKASNIFQTLCLAPAEHQTAADEIISTVPTAAGLDPGTSKRFVLTSKCGHSESTGGQSSRDNFNKGSPMRNAQRFVREIGSRWIPKIDALFSNPILFKTKPHIISYTESAELQQLRRLRSRGWVIVVGLSDNYEICVVDESHMMSDQDPFQYCVVEEAAIKTIRLNLGEVLVFDARLIHAGAPGRGHSVEHAAYMYADAISLIESHIANSDSLLWRQLCCADSICMTLDQYSFWAAEIENDRYASETKIFLDEYFTVINRKSSDGDMGLDVKSVKDMIYIYRTVHELMFSRRLWRHWNQYSPEFQKTLLSIFCEHRRRFVREDHLTTIRASSSIYSINLIPVNGMACMRDEVDFDMPGLDGEIGIDFEEPENHDMIKKNTASILGQAWFDTDILLRDPTLPSDSSAQFVVQCKWTDGQHAVKCLLTPITSQLIGPIVCDKDDLSKFSHPILGGGATATHQTLTAMQTQADSIGRLVNSITHA